MPLSASALAATIKLEVNSINVEDGEITNDAVIDAIASAIVNHIKDNAKAIVSSGSSSGQWPII